MDYRILLQEENDAVRERYELSMERIRSMDTEEMGLPYGCYFKRVAAFIGQIRELVCQIEAGTELTLEELEGFTQKVRSVNCGLCGNNCQLTVNIFPGGKKYISGNRCDRPVSHRGAENPLNLYEYKQRLLAE